MGDGFMVAQSMPDNDRSTSLKRALKDVTDARRKVDEHMRTVHRLEALGKDDAKAQARLESLLAELEAAQQRLKGLR